MLNLYDITDWEAEYIKPTLPLPSTINYTHFPDAAINASLYNMTTREPVGTIWEDRKVVHNEGNGYGVGIVKGKLMFGKPWDQMWDYYLTGYTTCVQDGKWVAPTFNDAIFNTVRERIAIAKLKNGRVVIATDDAATLKVFSERAIEKGVDILVNLDGGGSRYLYYKGQNILWSNRVPYNALLFYDRKNAYTRCEVYKTFNDIGCIGRNDDKRACIYCPNRVLFQNAVKDIIKQENS